MYKLLWLLFFPSFAFCCPSACTCNGNTVNCQRQGLSSLPNGIPTTTEELNLQENNFAVLTTNMFDFFTNLKILRLDSSAITTLEPGAFNGVTTLTQLSLKSNSIQSFPDNIFAPFASTIQKLDLSKNLIDSLSAAGLFNGMTSLTTLDLSKNQLASIPDDVFADLAAATTFTVENNVLTTIGANSLNGLTSVSSLNLHNNAITSISAGSFSGLISLKVINLNTNSLTTFAEGVFSDLARLEEINLQSNRIDTLTSSMFSNLSAIETINLRSNNLATGYDVFGSIPSLRNLDLSLNRFTSISNFIFLPNLRTLDLRENQIISITGLPFAALSAIQTIYLQHNEITLIDAGMFGGLEFLNLLDLSYNNLTAVPSSSFNGLFGTSKVQNLILRNNQIQSVAANAFVDCQNVRTIDLRNNSMTTLTTNSFADLAQVRTIYLSHNRLTVVPSQAFTSLSRLETIHLKDNLLERVEAAAFENLNVIASLDLSHNVIHTIEDGAFVATPMLTSLFLNSNRLTMVPKGALTSLASLRTLNISLNLISALNEARSFGDLTSLSFLYAQSNRIANMAEDCLGGMPALVKVDLSLNRISDISVALITSNNAPSFAALDLASNKIATVSAVVFSGFEGLQTLNLSNNAISLLPDGLLEEARTTLTLLVMTGNSWQCDCDLRWLQINFTNTLSGGVCASPADKLNNTLGTNGTWVPDGCEVTTLEMTTQPETTSTTIPILLSILTSPFSLEVDSGETVSLPCKTSGSLSRIITWISPDGSGISSGQQFLFNQSTGTLTISGITYTMAGIYQCTATNAVGEYARISVDVTVRFPPIIVRFLKVSVMPDTSSILICDVEAYPLASIYWTTHDGTFININSTGSLIMTSSGTLHMADRVPMDSGHYTCFASNELGDANERGYLFIYNSTSIFPVETRTVEEEEKVVLDCGSLVTPSDSGFAWELPTGHIILYSNALSASGENNVTYISPTFSISYLNDGSHQSTEIDRKYSVIADDGSLTIIKFLTTSLVTTDAVTSQAGSYSCRTVNGVYNYDVNIGSSGNVVELPSSGLSELAIYYMVLGALLLVVLGWFIYYWRKMRRKKRSSKEE